MTGINLTAPEITLEVKQTQNTIQLSTMQWSAQLNDIAGLARTDGIFIVRDGLKWVAESGNTARTSLGLGTGDSPTFAGAEIGDAVNYAEIKTDGEINLHGTARVEKALFFDLTKMKLGVGNPPGESVEDGFRTYNFDNTNEEEMFATFYGPLEWAPGTGAEVLVGFFVDTAPATAKNVVLGVEYKSIACDGTFDFTSGTTTVTGISAITTGTPANDKGIHCAELTIPSEGLIEGGLLMLRLFRNATSEDDTFAGDARIFDVHIHYTADKLGAAT